MASDLRLNSRINGDGPGAGVSLGSMGGPLYVLNDDTKTAQNDPDDPHSIMNGDHADDANVHPRSNPGCAYLDLVHFVSGATAISQNVKVRVYGFIPMETVGGETPHDFDGTNFDAVTETTLAFKVRAADGSDVKGYLIPLVDSEGDNELEFSATNADKNSTAGGAKVLKVQGPRSVYVAGVDWVIVTVSQALVGPAAGMILGRFVN